MDERGYQMNCFKLKVQLIVLCACWNSFNEFDEKKTFKSSIFYCNQTIKRMIIRTVARKYYHFYIYRMATCNTCSLDFAIVNFFFHTHKQYFTYVSIRNAHLHTAHSIRFKTKQGWTINKYYATKGINVTTHHTIFTHFFCLCMTWHSYEILLTLGHPLYGACLELHSCCIVDSFALSSFD